MLSTTALQMAAEKSFCQCATSSTGQLDQSHIRESPSSFNIYTQLRWQPSDLPAQVLAQNSVLAAPLRQQLHTCSRTYVPQCGLCISVYMVSNSKRACLAWATTDNIIRYLLIDFISSIVL